MNKSYSLKMNKKEKVKIKEYLIKFNSKASNRIYNFQ